MKHLSYLIFLLIFAYHSVFGDDGSVFSSLRRDDYSSEKTYHFARVNKYTPITEPIIYRDGYMDDSKMIVAFNNMVVFGKFENEKHYVIRVDEDLNEDYTNIPAHFLDVMDSGELFEIVTLKPTTTTTTTRTTTTTTTTTTPFPRFYDTMKEVQRQALPGFDPDKQSLQEYLERVSANFSRLASEVDSYET